MKLFMRKANDCIFCRIVEKTAPAKIHYEDEHVLAFNDRFPAAPIHVLIIPKTHIKSVAEIKPEHYEAMAKINYVAQEVAKKLNIDQTGYRLINNCGRDANQSVFHLHYHLIGGRNLGSKIVKEG